MNTVILGLGSNIGDRLAFLRQAATDISAVPELSVKQISPIYISDALMPDNAPKEWDRPYLNCALRCETESNPHKLLTILKEIEWRIGRKPEKRHWGPREIDIDILAFNQQVIDDEQLTVPHKSLLERPFALWPLADVAPLWIYPQSYPQVSQTAAEIAEKFGSRFSGEAKFNTRQIPQRLDCPQLMGILNVTPDSYSDGGKYQTVESAIEQARQLITSGAEILDIGAESTSPIATAINADIEWQRLEPILSASIKLKNEFDLPPKISIDTRYPSTAEKALALGVDWINDVTGLDNPEMRSLIIDSGANCVVMHHKSIPEDRNNSLPRDSNVVEHIYNWGQKRINELEQAGINKNQIIFDPGIGFGIQADQSIQLLQHAKQFKQLGTKLLIGHSRKSFMNILTPKPFAERDIETVAASLALANANIDYLRVHNVDAHARAFRMMRALPLL